MSDVLTRPGAAAAPAAFADLEGKALLDEADALRVRRAVYGAGPTVSPAAAETVWRINAAAGRAAPAWGALFLEVLVDRLVHQADPPGYVGEADAAWLIAKMGDQPHIREDEVELLIRLLETAEATPDALSRFVLEVVRDLAIARARSGGRLHAEDVERLRRTLFACGGETAVQVSRREAEALFDVNDAVRGGPQPDVWPGLFARAVANSVLYACPWRPDAERERRDEAWLEGRGRNPEGHGGFIADLEAEAGAVLHDILTVARPDAALVRRESADEALEADAERLTAEEAHWLLTRLHPRGERDAAETALLAFLQATARELPPELKAAL